MGSYSDYEYENVLDEADEADDASSAIPRTRSSLGLSLLAYSSRPSQVSFGSSSRSSVGSGQRGAAGDDACVFMPPHRPLVGGGAAAAFEAARHDFYLSRHAERVRERDEEDNIDAYETGEPLQLRENDNMERQVVIDDPDVGDEDRSVGSNYTLNAPVQFVESPRRDAQYDLLRLYHMNLLQRMEETSFILNLVHQQQRQELYSSEPVTVLSLQQPRLVVPPSPSGAITPIRFLSIPTPGSQDESSIPRRPRPLDLNGGTSRPIEDDEDDEDDDNVNVQSSSAKRQRRN